MLYRRVIAVCSGIHTKHLNVFCGQKVECFDAKLCDIQGEPKVGIQYRLYCKLTFGPPGIK